MISDSQENFHLAWSKNDGYYAVAARDMAEDEVVSIETAFCSVLGDYDKSQTCSSCLKQEDKMMQCSRCKSVAYCSKDCQVSHWKQHKIECTLFSKLKPVIFMNHMNVLAIRTYLQIFGDQVNLDTSQYAFPISRSFYNRAQPTQDDLNKFNSMLLPRQCNHSPLDVLFLDGHYSEMQIEILQPMMKLLFLILTELGIKKDDPSRFYDNNTALLEVVNIFCILKCNCFGEQQDLKGNLNFFPRSSFFNHSCSANIQQIIQTENGKRISTFRTTSTVKQGEPLLVSYVNDNDSYIMRQAKLRRGWFFTCKCHRCMQTIEAESKLKEQIEANIDYIRRMIQTKENNRMDVEKLNLLEQTKIADEEHLAGIGKQSNIKQKGDNTQIELEQRVIRSQSHYYQFLFNIQRKLVSQGIEQYKQKQKSSKSIEDTHEQIQSLSPINNQFISDQQLPFDWLNEALICECGETMVRINGQQYIDHLVQSSSSSNDQLQSDQQNASNIHSSIIYKFADPPSYFVCLKCLIPRYIIKEEQNAIQKLIEDKLVQIEQIKEIIEQFSVKRFEREQQKDMKKKIKEQIEAKEEKKFIQDIEQELKKLRESQIIKIERVKDNEEEKFDMEINAQVIKKIQEDKEKEKILKIKEVEVKKELIDDKMEKEQEKEQIKEQEQEQEQEQQSKSNKKRRKKKHNQTSQQQQSISSQSILSISTPYLLPLNSSPSHFLSLRIHKCHKLIRESVENATNAAIDTKMGRPSLKLIGIEEEIALTCYAGKESEKVFDFYVKKALIALLAFNVIVARESYVQMMSLYSQIEHHSARYLGLIVQIKMDLDRMSGVDKNEDEMKEQDLIDKFGFERDEDQDNIEDELFGIDRKRDVERDADDGEDKKKDRQRKEKEKKVGG